ncbi:DNA polymerase [Staphylococcus aureus]
MIRNIHDAAGEDFNINSPKQLGVVLFLALQLPVIKKTKNRIFYCCRCLRAIAR